MLLMEFTPTLISESVTVAQTITLGFLQKNKNCLYWEFQAIFFFDVKELPPSPLRPLNDDNGTMVRNISVNMNICITL